MSNILMDKPRVTQYTLLTGKNEADRQELARIQVYGPLTPSRGETLARGLVHIVDITTEHSIGGDPQITIRSREDRSPQYPNYHQSDVRISRADGKWKYENNGRNPGFKHQQLTADILEAILEYEGDDTRKEMSVLRPGKFEDQHRWESVLQPQSRVLSTFAASNPPYAQDDLKRLIGELKEGKN